MTAAEMYDIVLLGLCVWRESRNQPKVAQMGVAWSVKNRVLHPAWWGKDYVDVILKPYQYSSFNHNDPNAVKLPYPSDPSWQECLEVAQDVYQDISTDPTQGCTHYFDGSMDSHPPDWTTSGTMEHVTNLGELRFWRLTGTKEVTT